MREVLPHSGAAEVLPLRQDAGDGAAHFLPRPGAFLRPALRAAAAVRSLMLADVSRRHAVRAVPGDDLAAVRVRCAHYDHPLLLPIPPPVGVGGGAAAVRAASQRPALLLSTQVHTGVQEVAVLPQAPLHQHLLRGSGAHLHADLHKEALVWGAPVRAAMSRRPLPALQLRLLRASLLPLQADLGGPPGALWDEATAVSLPVQHSPFLRASSEPRVPHGSSVPAVRGARGEAVRVAPEADAVPHPMLQDGDLVWSQVWQKSAVLR